MITTYTMIAFTGTRSAESKRVMDAIESREWGLLLMDEVHVVPAEMFRKVCASNPAKRINELTSCFLFICTFMLKIMFVLYRRF